ncbi:CHAD domain-containing protein [Brevifollis gellanilyticus]|uniref:CHAD domain-containing protein n=1 Tax=Brevifollis gellanilyticus TaxID=748831 RepID=A0A512M9T2_9BACT|nr:CHAD domain-containing protein [Brevifollis gellanilyticus]GEP43498.1 CHAD domain-containing protein [Brevifollis gellanilyticus]
MSYRLRKQSISHEVRRVARKALEGGLKEMLTLDERGSDTAVHEARKHLKRVRALIRLIRPAMGDAFYKRENAALRETAQRMASIRDAHVRVQTIQKLIARSRSHRAAFDYIHEAMNARLQEVLDESGTNHWNRHVAADIEHAICRVDDWPVQELEASSLRDGLKSAFKKARRALATAQLDLTDDHLHTLRKRIKDVRYHLQLLGGDHLPQIEALTQKFRDLGDTLGDDHDLAELLTARDETPLPHSVDWANLERAIAALRTRSQRAALRLATSLLAPKPRAFADLILDHWEKWRSSP